MNYFVVVVVYFFAHTALVGLTDVSLNYAEHCDDAAQCYSKFMQCSSDGEEMVLKLTPLPLPKQKTPHPLFYSDKNLNLVILYLKFDTSEIVNSIKQTTQNGINPPKTDPITEKVMYYPNNPQRLNGKSSRQFKRIHEVYGIVDIVKNSDKIKKQSFLVNSTAFFRGTIHFVNCGQIRLIGFVRHGTMLYQLRPHFSHNKNQNNYEKTNKVPLSLGYKVHQLLTVVTDLTPSDKLFTLESFTDKFEQEIKEKTFTKRKKDATENKYCLSSAIADLEFFQSLNSDPAEVVINIKTAYMLANEIFANTEWDRIDSRHIKVGLPVVRIDLTIAGKLEHLTEEEMIKELFTITSSNYCLVHLFTGRGIYQNNDKKNVTHGISVTSVLGHIFGVENVGASSIYGCGSDPWKVQCLFTFPHELAHSMGALHDVESKKRDNQSYLMTTFNQMETPISAKNLKLSPLSVELISRFLEEDWKFDFFIKAASWTNCSNGIIEVSEQCDEGSAQMCCNNCQLAKQAKCSPFNSLCCTNECQFKNVKQFKNSINFENEFDNACIPWNYCPEPEFFCANKKLFCSIEKNEIDCESLTTTTTTTTTTITTTTAVSIVSTEIITTTNTNNTHFNISTTSSENSNTKLIYIFGGLAIIFVGLAILGVTICFWFKNKIKNWWRQYCCSGYLPDDQNKGEIIELNSHQPSSPENESSVFIPDQQN